MKSQSRTKLKSFFLLFIISISLFYGFIGLASTASATTSLSNKSTTITADWLSVQPDMSDIDNNFKFYKDQGLLTAFNRGSEDHGDGTITFRYEGIFDLKTILYSSFDVKDFYPNMKEETLKYEIFNYEHIGIFLDQLEDTPYYQTFPSYNFGEMTPHEFNGIIPLKMDLNPDFYNPEGEKIGDIVIGETNYAYKIKQLQVTNTSTGRVDKYKDIYSGAESDRSEPFDFDLQSSNDVPDKFIDEVEEYEAGAWRRDEITKTKQKGIADPVRHIGTSIDNTEWGQYTFEFRANLEPQVTRTKEDVKRKRLKYQQHDSALAPDRYYTYEDSSPSEKTPYIQKSAHVYNYYIETDYTVKVLFETDMEIENYEEDPAYLENPSFTTGDWYWNYDDGGYEGMSMPTERIDSDDFFDAVVDFFGDLGDAVGGAIGSLFGGFIGGLFSGPGGFLLLIILIIATIIGIYLFIKIGLPFIRGYFGGPSRAKEQLDS